MADKFTLKARIKTFESIGSLTYSMQIISIIKLKKIMHHLTSTKPLTTSLEDIIKMVLCNKQKLDLTSVGTATKKLVLVVTANRGFCGEYNSEVRKAVFKNYDTQSDDNIFYVIGKKGKETLKPRYFKNIKYISLYNENKADKENSVGEISLILLRQFVEDIASLYADGEIKEISLVYNAFESILKQRATNRLLYPIALTKDDYRAAESFIFEPEIDEAIFVNYLQEYLNAMLFLHLLESEAGEMGARFIMMKNATDSCKKSKSELTLELNKIRQAGITKDLSEIVSGFKVLKRERG